MFKLEDIIHCLLKYKDESGVHEVKLKELIFILLEG